jgi:transcriptional regulator with XRE-family HTH domain
MTTNEIKAFFALRGLSLSAVAMSIGEDRSAVSRVVNYERPGPRIRKLLKARYRGLKFDPITPSQERKAA